MTVASFRARQLGLLGLSILLLLVALAGSDLLRGLLSPLMIPVTPYLNPFILATLILYGSVGLVTLFRASDRGWPWYMVLMGMWVFVVAFEDSILQWFVFQFGASTIGGRVDPMLITAAAAAFGTGMLMHTNQLSRRLRQGLLDRGIEPAELEGIEAHAAAEARGLVVKLVAMIGAASVILWVLQFVLGRLSLGLGLLGILGGLIIVAVISIMAYQALRKGPVPGLDPEAEARANAAHRRTPPAGLKR